MTRKTFLFSVAAVLSCLLPCSTATLAQDGQGAGDEPLGAFAEAIEVHVVNVDVFVVDKDGRRVMDLGRDDFEIYEDGSPMTISNFYRVESRPAARAATAAPEAPPAAGAEAGEELPAEEKRLHLVVYIDNANIMPFHRNNLMGHVRTFLRNLGNDDRIAVYTYEKALHLRQEFTTDRAKVNDVLFEIETISAHGVSDEKDRQELIRDIDRSRALNAVEGRVKMYALSKHTDLTFTIDALKQTVDALAGLPGRKAILYVSDGLEMRVAEDLYKALAERFGDPTLESEALTYDASRSFRELTASANANDVTFYTIEAAGLRAYSSGTADTSASRSYQQVDAVRRLNRREPLQSMAAETGGLAVIGTSNFADAMDRLAEDLDGYYSLGYVSPQPADGRYHEIEVRTRDQRLKVRHKDGYRAKSSKVWMAEKTLAALTYDVASNPLDLRVEIRPPVPGEDRQFLVPIVLRVPIGKIALLPYERFFRGQLKVFLSTVDPEGRRATVSDQPWPVEIPIDQMERAKEMLYAHELSLMMRPGPQKVAVGVLDEVVAESSFVVQTIDVR